MWFPKTVLVASWWLIGVRNFVEASSEERQAANGVDQEAGRDGGQQLDKSHYEGRSERKGPFRRRRRERWAWRRNWRHYRRTWGGRAWRHKSSTRDTFAARCWASWSCRPRRRPPPPPLPTWPRMTALSAASRWPGSCSTPGGRPSRRPWATGVIWSLRLPARVAKSSWASPGHRSGDVVSGAAVTTMPSRIQSR